MFGFFRKRIELNRRVEQRADDLILLYGFEALRIAYESVRKMAPDRHVHAFNCRVQEAVERRLNISPPVGTPKSYLDR